MLLTKIIRKFHSISTNYPLYYSTEETKYYNKTTIIFFDYFKGYVENSLKKMIDVGIIVMYGELALTLITEMKKGIADRILPLF